MATRAAICIGVNQADGMTTLQAAAKGARDVAAWATAQGCDVTLLVDDDQQEVYCVQVFKAVRAVVEAGTYEQLLIYFSGHGILLAPGTEYWLLSGAPQNPNEAVNLLRSVEDARNAGIPHVIFFSDACRSAVPGAPLNGVVGGSIFPNRTIAPQSGEVDVFFATRPGDPAWEVPEAEATRHYRGLFTDCLLKALHAPGGSLVEKLPDSTPALSIITSRRLKSYLEQQVPLAAAAVNIRLTQQPVVRVETASPKYFAVVPPVPLGQEPPGYQHDFTYGYRDGRGKQGRGLFAFPSTAQAGSLRPTTQLPDPGAVKLAREVAQLRGHPGQLPAETTTGFTLIGAFVETVVAPGWEVDYPAGSPPAPTGQFIRLVHQSGVGEGVPPSGTMLLQFRSGTGALLAVLPGFIGVVLVAESRVLNVNYLPALATTRFQAQATGAAEREKLKALAAVHARYGEFNPRAVPLATWLHGPHGFDPTLGLYAAYGYAQRGQYAEVARIQHWLAEDQALPQLFDVELLTARYQAAVHPVAPGSPVVPFTPLLAQGWALLTPDNPRYHPLHERLRAHLLPALWTTYTAEGVALVRTILHPPTTP
ncbi:MAG: caspase family protein [Janthinobacterium lividum]